MFVLRFGSLCLCSSNLRRKTMPAAQGLAVAQQRGIERAADDFG